ncbi:MAG: radical SAM protein [Candidatus Cloacimonetes bacterium 4572_55]|nr:MAG: radical SAM protein [Candidatus Cloacimonetes bacterium 4572_55]
MRKKFVFGPVASRRLGRSLGVDPIPHKTCNLNCVYCQLGRSQPVVNERKSYFPPEEIVAETLDAIRQYKGKIDWISFVGSGEPTLHSDIGKIIREVQSSVDLPVCVITNGALLYRPEVRSDLLVADAVLPSLDAGSPELYRRINRPHHSFNFNNNNDFDRLIRGAIEFRREYKGALWVETMLIRGMNDTESALRDIAEKLEQIRPDQSHILLPIRSPSETWALPSNDEGVMRARAIFGSVCKVIYPHSVDFDLNGFDNLADAVSRIVSRHPIEQTELERALARCLPVGSDLSREMEKLQADSRVRLIERHGVRFWTGTSSDYPATGEFEKISEK